MSWQKNNSNDEATGVCRPCDFVDTTKESTIFDMAKKNRKIFSDYVKLMLKWGGNCGMILFDLFYEIIF